MNSGAVEELRLTCRITIVDADSHNLAPWRQGAKGHQSASPTTNGGSWVGLHHRFILIISWVAVPCIGGTIAIPHLGFLAHRGWSLKVGLVASLNQPIILFLVGICLHSPTVGAIYGTYLANGLYFLRVVDTKSEIILATLTHELAQFSLVLGIKWTADNSDTEKDEIM